MDGTYNNPYAQGQSQSPLSPQTPGGYQVNVSRQKTRKWVQAPVQNYDGDDWGADEFDDDEPPPPPPPVSRVTTGLRSVGQRPSESYGPSPRLAAAVASSSRGSSGPPSLQLETQHPAEPSNAAPPEQLYNVSSPVAGRNGSPVPVSSGAGSSKPPSFQQQPEVRSSTPQSPSSSARASPSIRPDLYRHIDDERKLGGSPLSITENVAPRPNDRSSPPVHEPSRQGHGQGDDPVVDRVQKQPTFDSILAKRDELHVGQSGSNDAPVLDSAETWQQINNPKEESVLHSPTDIDRKRMSVSPQLPDVARMSVFGADFFSSDSGNLNAQGPVKQEQPLASKQSINTTANLSTLNEKPQEGEVDGNESRLGNASSNQSSLIPANDPRSVPPLRTPSPNTKGLYPSLGDPASGSAATGSKITPTEPLHPQPSDYSPSNYEPNSALTQGTMNTFNSSPIKESDVLSEEIMRSLSPIAPTPNSALARPAPENTQSLTPGGQNEMRNSSYTLSDYDNYWADSIGKPEQGKEKLQAANAPVNEPQQEPTEQPLPGDLASSGPKPASPPDSPNAESRRRFSWEAGFDSPPKILPVEAPAGNVNKEASAPGSPSPVVSTDAPSSQNPVSIDTSQTNESPQNIEAPKIIIPPSGAISHQVSKASTLPPSQQQTTLEPPSPVSVEHNDSTPQAIADRRPSVVDDKPLAKTSSTLAPTTPPPEISGRSIPSSSEFPQTTPWRDIMTLATPVQRTLKFEAGRDTHQAWESGLDNWLSSLMIEHPEYANSTASFSGVGGMPASQKGHASGPSVSHTQQYFNASSPTTGQPAAGRSRVASSVPSGSSGFGNSSNQIGTKSKELMQSAGKMGKGLFSKGKSKLRGTGDKGEPTSPVQTKFKTERRASWGLDRLARSRADETSEKDVVNSRPSTQSYHAPQSSQSSSIPPFGPVPPTGESGKQIALRESDEPQFLQDASAVPSREHDDRSQWYIPTPIDESTWDPFRETNLDNFKASKESRALVTNDDQPQQEASVEAPFSKPLSGGAPPVPDRGSVRMVPSEEHSGSSHQPMSVYATVTSQETPRDVQHEPQPRSPTQPTDLSITPQRHSSFVGLPLIRRGSTFDVNPRPTAVERRPTEPIDERVSADDEGYDEILRQQGTITSEVTVGSTLVGTDSIAPDKEYKKDVDDPETPAMTPERQRRASQQRSPQAVPRHSLQMHPVNQGPMPPHNPEYQNPSLPLLPPHLMGGGGNPVQRLPPSGPWKLEESHLSEPLHRVTPKASPLLPSGQWKLEESHLAEPLHVVNRNRAGTNASQISQRSQHSRHSQHDPSFGYNKETGDVPASPSSSSATPYQHHHQRQKPSEVPPSTTNRYPGLFSGQQPPQGNSQETRSGLASQVAGRLSHEEGISRTGTSGNEVPGDDRGRSRGASALFKDIGHRFRKSSTERQRTPVDNYNPYQPPQLPEANHDAASVSSVATDGTNDRKKSRASFMLGLRNKQSREKLSMPPPPRPEDSRPHTAIEDKRASRINPGLGIDSAQSRPSGVPRAATSNLANELSQNGSATPPPKKRFSAFNAKAAMTNVFNRPSSGTYAKPGTPTTSRPISSHLGVQQPVSLERSHPGFERSNTAGPTFNQMLSTLPNAPPADASDRRTRRGSAAGLISGLLGHGHKSKEGQQSASPQMQQHLAQQSHDRHPSELQLNPSQHGMPQSQDQSPSGPQLPTPVLQMPGAFPETPGIPTPQSDVPPLASPQPQRPQPFVNQQPPMVRQMVGDAVPREQSPMLTSRTSSGAIRESQHAQTVYRNSRPSPLGFGSTTPAGTPPIVMTIDHSRHSTPQTPFSVGQGFHDPRTEGMRSISPAASGIRSAPTTQTSFNIPNTAPTTQTSFHHPSQSFEKLSQHMQEIAPIQRPVTDSPNMSFRQNARPGQIALDDGMPLSPVSQASKTGPPSVSSMATQSPRLNSSFPTSGRRQSSQISQPETPVIPAASTSPPVQAFTSRMGILPQQQQSSNFSSQAGPPRQGAYQMASGRLPMQMQGPDGNPPVPPKNETSHLQQPQVVDQPARQGSPGVSKWKGLKNRMSAQVVHKSQPSQGKTEADKDKLTASKILGAFKRGSKENRQSMVIPDFQAYQQHQMGAPQQRQPLQQHSTAQVPYGQAQSPRPSSNVGGQPFGQAATSRPLSHLSNQSTAQLQYKRQSSMFISPPLPQQQIRSSSGSIPQGQLGMHSPQHVLVYQPPQPQGEFLPPNSPTDPTHRSPRQQGHYQSPPQHQGQFQSPSLQQRQFPSPPPQQGQFGSPIQHQGQIHAPIQIQGQFQSPPQSQGQWQHQTHSLGNQPLPTQSRQASYPGQWQGTIGQSPNSPAHQSPRHSHFSQQPYSPQPGHPSQQMVHGEESHPVHVSTPDTVHAPTPVHAPSPRPSLLNLLASGSIDTEGPQQENRGHTDLYSGGTNGNPRASASSSPNEHISPEIGTEQNGGLKNQVPSLPMPVFASESVGEIFIGAGSTTDASRGYSPKAEESQGVSISPPTATTRNASSGPTRPSPPSIGDSRAPSQPKPSGGPSFHAELENTEDARKRTLRLNSQEEKIHYDPNADSDGEVPAQMSATSYPGQEWNPYGMTEVGDWNEALYR